MTTGAPAARYSPTLARFSCTMPSKGAAIVVLEALEHARARGAPMYAEVRGYGQSNDAYHMLAPRPDGEYAAQAVRTRAPMRMTRLDRTAGGNV